MSDEEELPEGWVCRTLEELTPVDAPIQYGILQPGPDVADGVPYVRPTEIRDDSIDVAALRRTSPEIARKYRRAAIRDGDVLLSIVGSIGKVAVVPTSLCGANITQSSARIRPIVDRVTSAFLAFFLRSPLARAQFDSVRLGTGVPRLNIADVRRVVMPLPPISEQKRIVQRLVDLSRAVTQAKERLSTTASVVRLLRRAILAGAFEGRLTGDDQSDWRETSLGKVLSVQTGATPLRTRPEYFDGGTVPWIKTGQVQNADIHGALEFITDRAVAETNAKVFPAGTILIAMYGEGRTRGQVARLRIAAATNQACAALVNRGLPEETLDFVYWYLRSRYDAMRHVSVGGNQPNLSLGIIKSWPVVLPPAAVQREIVHRVEALFALADAIEKRVAAASARADKLTQAILAKAFCGDLVPTEAELNRRRQANGAPAAVSPATALKAPRRAR